MKLMSFVVLSFTILPCLASAFSLDSVQSIECTGRFAAPGVSVFFTTTDASAHQYTRHPGTIPYDYGNKKSPSRDTQTGQMVLANNPDAERGIISLVDSWNPSSVSSLVLKSTGKPGYYYGELSGNLESAQGWQKVRNLPLNCFIK
jgi:hypothetical protein